MRAEGRFDFIDDKECIPLVEFFNQNGLRTWMCCSGVNGHGYGFFYIYFDRSVTQQDIEYFMSSHLTNKRYCSTQGWFCKRIWWKPDETWAYVVDSVDNANVDLEYFKRTNKGE